MRIIYLILFLFVFVLSTVQSQWDIFQGEKGDIYTLDFASDSLGWMAGSCGLLFKTENAGETWEKIHLNNSWFFHEIDFVTNQTGWAAAGNSNFNDSSIVYILRSTDGGITWNITLSIHDYFSHGCKKLYTLNDSCAFIISDDNRIIITYDGGTNWDETAIGADRRRFRSGWFFSDLSIILTGYINNSWPDHDQAIILSSIDGGQYWDEKVIPDLSRIYSIKFINDSTGYFAANDNDGNNLLCKTEDRMETWSILKENEFYTSHFYFLDEELGYLLSNNYTLRSTDGGTTWDTLSTLLKGWSFQDADFNNTGTGHIITSIGAGRFGPFCGSALLRTMDGGSNWIIEDIFSYSYYDVQICDAERILISGGNWGLHYCSGSIFETNSALCEWKQLLSTDDLLKEIFLKNDNIYAMSGDYFRSILHKSEDGGDTWSQIFNGDFGEWGDSLHGGRSYFTGTAMYFLNEDVGWAAGTFHEDSICPAILNTTDGGENWEFVFKKSKSWGFNSVYFMDQDHGWAVGNRGLVVKYTNGNQWELVEAVTDLPLRSICFSDENNGWIGGGYSNLHGDEHHAVLLNTNNSGKTWMQVDDFDFIIYDIYFDSAAHGWFAGCDSSRKGILLETNDGGKNFTIAVDDLIVPLRAIDFEDELGIVVGGGIYDEYYEQETGIILKTENGGATWIDQKNGKTYTHTFKLSQNYPNPFNAKTVISYQLSAFSEVELSIYNILGQKVKTLVSEKQPAGTYKVQWDTSPASCGQGFASGVYIYQLKAGSQEQKAVFTKKLVLLK